jgi:hypothetical protein
MIIYNPILGGKYIRELNLDIDKKIEVDKKKGLELLEAYPFLVDTDEPKYKPSYIDIKKTKNIEKTKKNIWHIIKSKIRLI